MASVVMVDVDHFKEFNDRYGHETGDRVLTALAAALRQAIRCTDEVARLGGDEFILLLRDCGAENAVKVGQKILDRAEAASVRVDSATHVNLEISVGIASCPDHAKSLEEASLLADVALLRAKESGRNQVAIYNPDVDGQVLATRGYGRGLSR
jgi:diguanylate cyclase (GGDEF)-like protein